MRRYADGFRMTTLHHAAVLRRRCAASSPTAVSFFDGVGRCLLAHKRRAGMRGTIKIVDAECASYHRCT